MAYELLYPTCPDCGNKASAGNGVDDVESTNRRFDWYCPECGTIHTGTFDVKGSKIRWLSHRQPTIRDRLKGALSLW